MFRKLLDRKTPIVIVRILLFWYSKQTVCNKWGRCISGFFCISNGVRQGGILSPKLFLVYIDDLSDKLVKCKVGCYIDNNNNNNNICLKSNIHSIIRYKFSGLYNGIKHGIHIKTVQCI